jgi:hypothetical protein
MSRQTTNKDGKTVKCSGALIRRFKCPRNKRGFCFPGFKKCEGCGYAIWTKAKENNLK